jgi:hypothetical protein
LSSAFQSLSARLVSKEEVDEEQKILDWVCDYNYQAQHHQACRLHCDNTSSWILEHPVFLHWMESNNPVLWFRGAPGSGKTILASYVVEHLLHSSAIEGYSVVFFYYDKSTNQSLSFQTFLASALRQLCIQRGIPLFVKEAFSAAKLSSGGPRPITINQLTSMIHRIILSDCRSMLVIDGMDEAEDITGICDFLITSAEPRTKFFISSRPHNVIADGLGGALTMSAPSESASSDIVQYINQKLNHDQRLRKMTESLKSHVRETLCKNAAGMYVFLIDISQCPIASIEALSFHYKIS